MNATSKTRLSKVHPILAEKIAQLSKALLTKSIDIEVVQGLRTYAEQNALFAQGRTKPGKRVTNARGGQSNHNFGVAVDVAPSKDGKIDWDDEDAFDVIGAEAKKLGLEWGGDWHGFVDRPHLQLPAPSVAKLRALYDKGGLPEVWKSIKADAKPLPPKAEVVKPEVLSTESNDKGVTTSEKPASETEGTPPPAPAVEIKASRPSLKSTAIAVFTFLTAPLAYVGIDVKQVGEFAKGNLTLAIKLAFVFALVVLACWIWNRAMDRAQQRTLKVMDAAKDQDSNNLRLV